MTIRTMAKILGISPAYLSLLINGKRGWRGDLKERYKTLVNTFVNTEETGYETGANKVDGVTPTYSVMVGGNGFEPMTSAMSTQRSKPLS